MRFGNFGRAFLLGTSSLAMAASPAVSASFDILVNTTASQTLNAGETGRVRAGATLSGSVFGLPTVDIVGSGASLNNEGGINGLNFMGGGVAVRGPIIGVSIDNSGTISNFGGGIAISTGADLSGGLLNQASGTISGRTFAIAVGVFGSSDISGLLDNSGTLTGGSGIGVLSSSNILGGVANRTGGTIFGRGTGIFTFDHSDIQGGVENETGATIRGFTFGILSAMTSDISGGIDNSGTITGLTAAIAARTSSDVSGGVLNQAGGVISGGVTGRGIEVSGGSDTVDRPGQPSVGTRDGRLHRSRR